MHREKPAFNAGEWTYEERKTAEYRGEQNKVINH
jgi:hypothetical protein